MTLHLNYEDIEITFAHSVMNEGTLLVSWDVVSMFPNIDNQLRLTAVRKALNARGNKLPSTNCILKAVGLCLKSNHSLFKENLFLQIHGTAMSPKNACSYADLDAFAFERTCLFCDDMMDIMFGIHD